MSDLSRSRSEDARSDLINLDDIVVEDDASEVETEEEVIEEEAAAESGDEGMIDLESPLGSSNASDALAEVEIPAEAQIPEQAQDLPPIEADAADVELILGMLGDLPAFDEVHTDLGMMM